MDTRYPRRARSLIIPNTAVSERRRPVRCLGRLAQPAGRRWRKRCLGPRLQVPEKIEVGRAFDKQASEECGRVRGGKCMETPGNLVLVDSKGQDRE